MSNIIRPKDGNCTASGPQGFYELYDDNDNEDDDGEYDDDDNVNEDDDDDNDDSSGQKMAITQPVDYKVRIFLFW